jgi:hypothetical protein
MTSLTELADTCCSGGKPSPCAIAATARAIHGLGIGAASTTLTLGSRSLYGRFGPGGFAAMAGLAAPSAPIIAALWRIDRPGSRPAQRPRTEPRQDRANPALPVPGQPGREEASPFASPNTQR